jgi:hypothetical protein
LALDANEGLEPETGTYHPLDYTLDKPIPTKVHDGTINTLGRTCGLCEPLTHQHTDMPPPPTYQRGKERIDYIFVSVGLLPSVKRSGILPYDQYFIADHRPCYLDFNNGLLFGNDTPTIAPSQYRGLQLHDPRTIQEYEKALLHQINYHKLENNINDPLLTADKKHWTEEHTKTYETIDTLMTESMISAERKVSKKISTKYAWSPELKASVSALRYWKLSLKRAHGQIISDSSLRTLQEEANIFPTELPNPLYITDVVKYLRQARVALKDHQKRHLELRSNHLTKLAEARVLTRCPALQSPEKTAILEKNTAKKVHHIIYREKKRQLFRKIGYLLYPSWYNGSLGCIDIPNADNIEPFPQGPDPQTWQRSWTTVTDQNTLAKHISAANQ